MKIISEYEEILSAKTHPNFAESIVKTLLNKRNLVRVTPTWRFGLIETDWNDNKFVDCAICGRAELIVSNDKRFDVLRTIDFPFVRMVRLQEYIQF